MLYARGCRSVEVVLDRTDEVIVRALRHGPLRFNQLRVLTGFHQYTLSKRLKLLQNYCVVKKIGARYYLCEDFVMKSSAFEI